MLGVQVAQGLQETEPQAYKIQNCVKITEKWSLNLDRSHGHGHWGDICRFETVGINNASMLERRQSVMSSYGEVIHRCSLGSSMQRLR